MMHMHHVSPTTVACVCTTLRKATRTIGRVYDEALAGHGLTTAQFAILRTIRRGEEVPLSRLAEQLVLDRTSLYRAIDPMAKAGWVALHDAPRGRTRLATLTPAGIQKLEEADPAWEALQQRIFDDFGAEDWAAMQRALVRLSALAAGDEA